MTDRLRTDDERRRELLADVAHELRTPLQVIRGSVEGMLDGLYPADPDRLRRFESEARAASQLNHPNILTVFDIGTDGGQLYVVAERLEGETLRDRLGRGPMAEREALELARQVARGLAAAHARGIVHRDLKPENLFLTRDGHVKILDFGLAKLTSDGSGSGSMAETNFATEHGVIVGTVQYMAPEQVKGQAIDQRVDLFAFGAVLFEMLTGKGPFMRPSRAESMSAVLNDTPPALDDERPGVSPQIARSGSAATPRIRLRPVLRFARRTGGICSTG